MVNADRGGDQSELPGLVGFQLSCPNGGGGGYGELDRYWLGTGSGGERLTFTTLT